MHHRAATAAFLLLILVGLSFGPLPVAAQDEQQLKPSLIKNVNTALTEGSNPHYFMPAGPVTYFFATQADGIPALWKTDGTSSGTRLVKAGINPGVKGYATYKGLLYFSAGEDATGYELWRTDGTTEGTTLFADLWPGPMSSAPEFMIVFEDKLFIVDTWSEYYETDGTTAGTVGLGGLIESPLVEFKNSLYYSYYSEYEPYPRSLQWFGSGGSGSTTDLYPGSQLFIYKDRLYFDAMRADVGSELWSTGGTLESIRLLKDINPAGNASIYSLAEYNDLLYFVESDTAHGLSLWRTDGSSEETVEVFDPAGSPGNMKIAGVVQPSGTGRPGGLLFTIFETSGERKLWRTDGTPGGTVMLADLGDNLEDLGNSSLTDGVVFNNTYYFPANDVQHGIELWRSDGTTAGTYRLSDMWPGAHGSLPNTFSPCGSWLCFSADDGVFGQELWRTDGTQAGTTLVADINTRPSNSTPYAMTPAGNLVYFYARDAIADPNLWRTDGTFAGTYPLNLDPNLEIQSDPYYYDPLTAVQGTTLYFPAFDPPYGEELWKTDGTQSGTVLLKDIWPGKMSSTPDHLVVANDHLFFFATGPEEGTKLWVSDGTTAGTHLLKELAPNGESYYPEYIATFGSQVLINISRQEATVCELWRSDGNSQGTFKISDDVCLRNGVEYNNKMYFSGVKSGAWQTSMWETDGTAEGTKEIPLDTGGYYLGNMSYLTPTKSGLYFIASVTYGEILFKISSAEVGDRVYIFNVINGVNEMVLEMAGFGEQLAVSVNMYTQEVDGPGNQLWISDGTEAGTRRLEAGFTEPSNLMPLGDRLFFSASDPINTEQIWNTDGSTAGTHRVTSYAQNRCSKPILNPRSLVYHYTGFILSLDDTLSNPPGYGCELWGLKYLSIDAFLPTIRR